MKYFLTLILFFFSLASMAQETIPSVTEDEGFIGFDEDYPAPVSPPQVQPQMVPQPQLPPQEVKTEMPEPKNEIKPEIPPMQPAQVAPLAVAPVQPPLTGGREPFDGNNYDTLNLDFRSLFFTSEQTDMFYNKLKKFRQTGIIQQPGYKLTQDASGKPGVMEKPFVYKSFYLGSILFSDNNDWTIWMNGQRLRKESNQSEVEVIEINRNAGTFLFSSENIDQYIKDYGDVKQIKKSDLDEGWSRVSDDGNIKLSTTKGLVQFKLKNNQSFILSELRIIEGKYIAPAVDTSVPEISLPEETSPPVTSPYDDNTKNDLDSLAPQAGMEIEVYSAE